MRCYGERTCAIVRVPHQCYICVTQKVRWSKHTRHTRHTRLVPTTTHHRRVRRLARLARLARYPKPSRTRSSSLRLQRPRDDGVPVPLRAGGGRRLAWRALRRDHRVARGRVRYAPGGTPRDSSSRRARVARRAVVAAQSSARAAYRAGSPAALFFALDATRRGNKDFRFIELQIQQGLLHYLNYPVHRYT